MGQQMSIYDVNNITIPTLYISSYITITTGLVFTTTLLASYFIFKSQQNKYSVVPRWPPGPKPWPLLGELVISLNNILNYINN